MSKTATNVMKCAVSIILVIALFLSLTAASFAWLVMNFRLEPQGDFYASSIAAYFAGGDGSKQNPYLITSPNHIYNLSWLQYLGVFNRVDNTGKIEKQFYFKMLNDVDMSGIVIPPIGTEENPFVGNFNGNSCTITNAVISNYIGDDGIKYYPASVETIDNTIKVDGGEVEASIVGFFGVVGNWNKSIVGLADDSLTVDIPSKVNSVYNFFLSDLAIRSDTDQSLMGLLAGYVDASIQNVGIGGTSSLVVGEDVKALNLSGLEMQALVSKYSLIGEYDELDVSWPDKPVLGGWGGSIDMANLYTRITDIVFSNLNSETLNDDIEKYTFTEFINIYLDEDGNQTRTETVRVDNAFIQYNKGSAGNYLLSNIGRDKPSTEYMYLYGNVFRTTINTYQITTFDQPVINITSGSNRLSLNNQKNGVTNSTNPGSATKWVLTDEGYLCTYDENGTPYYLNQNRTSFSVSDTPSTSWTYDGKLYKKGSGIFSTSYYIRCNSGNWTITTSSSNATNITLSDAGTVAISQTNLISTEYEYNEDPNNKGSWFPLAIDDETGEVANWNTGYVVSGSYENTIYPLKSGSIRVSRYELDNIINSWVSRYDERLDSSKIRTISYKKQSFGTVGSTKTSTDEDGNTVYTLTTNDYALEKFEHSFGPLSKTVNNQTHVYGLHFMDAQIDPESTIRIDKAVIMNKLGGYDEYRNYELPRNAITFNLSEKGFIDFYAGTYFSKNSSFFSLYKIERDKNKDIDTIREISKIYGVLDSNNIIDVTKDYIYEYKDDKNFEIPSGYTKVFDTIWITAPSEFDKSENISSTYFNYVYYFEIPVNDGEYALGSVKGSDGAYLIYLDLAANGTRTVSSTPAHTITGINFADASALSNKSIAGYPVVTMSAEITNNTHPISQIAYNRPSLKVVNYQADASIVITPVAETGATATQITNLITATASLMSLAWIPGKEERFAYL